MTHDAKPSRREFTAGALMALLGGVSVTVSVSGCGGGGSPSTGSSPTAASPPPAGSVSGRISSNHGHTATITAAELTAGDAIVLSIRGTAPHDHSVELSAAEVMQIAGEQRVVKRSSNDDSHFHEVTFN